MNLPGKKQRQYREENENIRVLCVTIFVHCLVAEYIYMLLSIFPKASCLLSKSKSRFPKKFPPLWNLGLVTSIQSPASRII